MNGIAHPVRTAAVTLALILSLSVTAGAQEENTTYRAQSDRYSVISYVSQAHARDLARQLEGLAGLYNEQFRFLPEELSAPMSVRVFSSQGQYDAYLNRLIDQQRDGFVYLHYDDPVKSELVGYHGSDEELERSFVHQSFVQFLRACIHNPPLWLQEGFAVYYEAAHYDPELRRAEYRENLAWLDVLKAIVAGEGDATPIPLESLLSASPDEVRTRLESFYPQAWGIVSFLLNSEYEDAQRILWDSISAMERDASREENVAAIHRHVFRWVDQNRLVDEFVGYVESRKTFEGWITRGIEQYDAEEYESAIDSFLNAVELGGEDHVPFYYLGLINYKLNDYEAAEKYYRDAVAAGAEKAITLYALGVNAYADNRFDDAVTYLEESIELDPSYREQAERILYRIRG